MQVGAVHSPLLVVGAGRLRGGALLVGRVGLVGLVAAVHVVLLVLRGRLRRWRGRAAAAAAARRHGLQQHNAFVQLDTNNNQQHETT